VPTTARLRDILAAHEKAANLKSAALKTIVEDWQFVDSGLHGTEHLERSGLDYHSRIVTSAYTEEFGQSGQHRWHRDRNGNTSPTSDLDDTSFIAVRVLEDAADPKNDVTVAGQTTGDKPAYVLQVKRPYYRHPEWIYYDAASGNVVRVEYFQGSDRIVSTYDDFRTVDGVTQPWHVHDAWWDRALDDDWHIVSFHAGAPIAPGTFAQPANTMATNAALTRDALQAQFFALMPVIRLKIGDRGLDFELNSAEPRSFIDRDVAAQLNLPTYGQATQLTTGDPWEYWTRIPDADVGPVHLHDFAIMATTFRFNPSWSTKVVGVLGYDFFASNVVHVDYANKTVEVIPEKMFAGDKPVQGGIELPFQLDDGVPFVPMQIGTAYTDRVIVNCAEPFTYVFGPFADAHADQIQEVHSQGRSRRFVPFADEGAYGTEADVWVSQVSDLLFSIADYQNLMILTTNFPYGTSGKGVDAMVGNDYLHFFDLYFDYPHNRFIVRPNKWFYETFKKS